MNATFKEPAPGSSLMKKAVRGGLWVLLARSVKWIFQFARTVILARLLAPNDFGLFFIAFLSLNLLEAFSITGMREALIQKPADIRPFLDTVWTIELTRAAVIALTLLLSAPLIASFFNRPEAGPLVMATGLAFVFQSLSNIAVILFEKEIEYDKLFMLEATRASAEFVVAVISYFIFRNVWALMLGRIAGEMTYCVLSYRIHFYRPKLSLNSKKAKELFTYGKWITFSSILVFIATKGDDLFVGKVLGVVTLGIYQMANKFSGLISTELIFPVLKVTYPAYSKIQANPARMKNAYLKVLQIVSFLAFLIGLIIVALADNIVLTLLGQKWKPAVILLRILVFPACLQAFQRTLFQMAKALGRPEAQTKAVILRVAVLAVFIYPGAVCFGAAGVALIVLLQRLVAFLWLAGMVIPLIDLSVKEFFVPIGRQLLSACAAGVVLFAIQRQLPYNPFTLCAESLLGMLLYIGMTRLFCRDSLQILLSLKSELFKTADIKTSLNGTLTQ